MKILQIITSLRIGGAEKLILDMVPLYVEAGHQVDVLLFDGIETNFKRDLQNKGIHFIEFSKSGWVYNPLYIFRLIPIIKRYDIVHTHNTSPQFFAAIANIICKANLVTTEHSTSNRRRHLFLKKIDAWMYRQYKCIICISNGTKNSLSSYLGYSKHMVVINNGINRSIFQQINPQIGMHKRFVLTMIAGFRPEKDQDTLIAAMKYLSKDKYEIWLVGDGERKTLLEQLVKNEKLEDNVRFLGIRNDIPNILKTSDVVVMSSHWEGFGLSAVEGMAAGKPVVASNVDGLAQVVGGAGILFKHGDAQELAIEIIKLTTDPDYYNEVAKRCVEQSKLFDIHNTVASYLNIYNIVFTKGIIE